MSSHEIPIVGQYDVVVVGSSVRAVGAAVEASRAGRSVFMAAPRTYPGEDMCATLRLWREADDEITGQLTERIFSAGNPASPMRVKKTLDQALADAKVKVVYGSCVTEVLEDPDGMLAGVVLANRAGRQGVQTAAVIDATTDAAVARLAGARFARREGHAAAATRVIVAREAEGASRRIPLCRGSDYSYFEYKMELEPSGRDFASCAEVEQTARDMTYVAGQVRGADQVFCLPADRILVCGDGDASGDYSEVNLDCFHPDGLENIFVLGPCASVNQTMAASLLRPGAGETAGRRLGSLVAEAAPGRTAAGPVCVGGEGRRESGSEDLNEQLSGLRPVPTHKRRISDQKPMPPVWRRYDVVVVGGGTSGASAAIGAARRGASVLVIEYQQGLGGTGTLGMIGKPYHGRSAGFGGEVPFPGDDCTVEDKLQWFRREIREAGGDIWFGALVCGAVTDGDRVTGVVAAAQGARGVVRADVVVDATGNADVAVAAGADAFYGDDPQDIAVQGAGIPARPLGESYVNTDYLLVDESDLVDSSRAWSGARRTMGEDAYDVAPLIQTRERRRVVGDHVLSYLDQMAGRTYGDSIVYSASDYDSHGYPSLPYFAMLPHDGESRKQNHPAPGGTCYTPYRCLLPTGLEGILVTGLGISMHRDASAMVRMQRDLHNQGYAAGVAAAMACESGVLPRNVNVRTLQNHLVETGALPSDAVGLDDNFPRPDSAVQAAVDAFGDAENPSEAGKPLAVILSHKAVALPMLREAFEGASGPARMSYARVLGFLGDERVVPFLRPRLEAVEEWDPKILQGGMAEYAHLPTPVDGLILALGSTGDPAVLGPILAKLQMLNADVTLSHHRAVALALERLGDPAAAQPLARLLGKPGMRGHVMTEPEPLYDRPRERRRRIGPLREIVIARALYRCGDHRGVGEEILREYLRDVRGLFLRHASAVLGETEG